ncbi:MAG: ISL3 family transposase [Chloroflexota bacterium]
MTVVAHSTAMCGICPRCGKTSRTLHGWHQRLPQDLPSVEQGIDLHLSVRRFCCVNPDCLQKTFVERFPGWLPVYARRTERLTQRMRRVAFEVGGEAGRRVLHSFQIQTSGDTLIRLMRATPTIQVSNLRMLGIDDWALKKGRDYGTILIDLEKHQVVDVLLERTALVVEQWLRQHPEIQVITRDRSTEYALGIQTGAPQAQVVADRWHLLLNLRQMLQRWLTSRRSQLELLPAAAEMRPLLTSRRGVFRRTQPEEAARQARRQQEEARYATIQRLRQAGHTVGQIARLLQLHPQTVRKNFYATSCPQYYQRSHRKSILDPFLPYLERRHAEGCENALLLWREIQQQGFPGTERQVLRWLHLRRTHVASSTPNCYRDPLPSPEQEYPLSLPSAGEMAWMLVQVREQPTGTEVLLLQHLLQDPEVRQVYDLAQNFVRMVKQRLTASLDPWLTDSASTSVVAFRHFALGIQQDYAAVRAALETSWSNGQTEGQVNRLKFIKRQMYGRAKLDLLRLRVLYRAPT